MADGNKAPATEQAAKVEIKTMTLAQRMAAIRSESFGIGKQDIKMKNKEGTKEWIIKSHTVEAVLSEIRPLLDKHGVGLIPMLVDQRMTGNLCVATFNFEFMDLETGEARVIPWAGAGTDNSDKALAKAGTNALKELLKKVFLITDRDDAKEEEETVEHKTDEGMSRAQVDKVAEKARDATEKWAKTFKISVEAAKDAKEVARLYRDNKTQLDELPEITRQFFDKLKADRIAFFAPPTSEEVANAERGD
jgi:hypothetical protein